MWVIMIESLIGIVLFTAVIVSVTLKNPLISVGDYPPAIQKKCMELGLIEDRKKRFTKADYIRKGAALIVFAALLAFVVRQFNGADTGLNLVLPFKKSSDSRNRGYGGIQGLSVPYQGFLRWDAARTARRPAGRVVRDDILVLKTVIGELMATAHCRHVGLG